MFNITHFNFKDCLIIIVAISIAFSAVSTRLAGITGSKYNTLVTLNHRLCATNATVFKIIGSSNVWPYLVAIRISWWYLRRFRSHLVSKQKHTPTNRHYRKQLTLLCYHCAAGKQDYLWIEALRYVIRISLIAWPTT